jgi:hypothetical protein
MATELKIDREKAKSVYSGKDGACCCGCSGTHYYASKHREEAGKSRGYNVEDKEINDKQVTRIINKIEKLAAAGVQIDTVPDVYFSAVEGKRLYIVYYN